MKLTKKWLLGTALLAALSFSFMGCPMEEDEDDSIQGDDIKVVNSVHTGSDGKEYTIAKASSGGYTATAAGSTTAQALTYNATSNTYSLTVNGEKVLENLGTKRAYSSTKLKHLGSLFKLELQAQSNTSDTGAVGIIWDLKKSDKARKGLDVDDLDGVLNDGADSFDADDAINFFIIGFKNYNGTLGYYISKFYNITSVNDSNFGATSTGFASDAAAVAGSAKLEQVIVDGNTYASVTKTANTSNAGLGTSQNYAGIYRKLGTAKYSATETTTIPLWVDIYPANYKKSYGLQASKYMDDDDYTGSFVVDIYLGDTEPTATSTPVETIVINKTQTGYVDSDGNGTKIKQAKLARYGNALLGEDMVGYVSYEDTYAEADTLEEDAE